MTQTKFNFKKRMEDFRNKRRTVYTTQGEQRLAACASQHIYLGSEFTVDLICELLESDEARQYCIDKSQSKYWADFIRKHCKE